MELPKRKNARLKDYDYSQNGAYFITICILDRCDILGAIVGNDAHIVPPTIELSQHGRIANQHIKNINEIYSDISIDKYYCGKPFNTTRHEHNPRNKELS